MGQPLWSIQIAEKERAAESINNTSTERSESSPGAASAAREIIWINVSEPRSSAPTATLRQRNPLSDPPADRMESEYTSILRRDFPEVTRRSGALLASRRVIAEARLRDSGWGMAPQINGPLLRMRPAQEMDWYQSENQTASSSRDVADVMPRHGRGMLVDMDYATPYIPREAGTGEADEEDEEEQTRVQNVAYDR